MKPAVNIDLPLFQIAPLKYRHVGAAAGLFGEWLFTFVTVFAGGIGIQTVGWKIWIWPLVFNITASHLSTLCVLT